MVMKAFDDLNRELAGKGLEGRVVTILTKSDKRKRINVYGKKVNPSILFGILNETINGQGLDVVGITNHREGRSPRSYQEGYFVSGDYFGVPGYVAITSSIPMDPNATLEYDAVKYP